MESGQVTLSQDGVRSLSVHTILTISGHWIVFHQLLHVTHRCPVSSTIRPELAHIERSSQSLCRHHRARSRQSLETRHDTPAELDLDWLDMVFERPQAQTTLVRSLLDLLLFLSAASPSIPTQLGPQDSPRPFKPGLPGPCTSETRPQMNGPASKQIGQDRETQPQLALREGQVAFALTRIMRRGRRFRILFMPRASPKRSLNNRDNW